MIIDIEKVAEYLNNKFDIYLNFYHPNGHEYKALCEGCSNKEIKLTISVYWYENLHHRNHIGITKTINTFNLSLEDIELHAKYMLDEIKFDMRTLKSKEAEERIR